MDKKKIKLYNTFLPSGEDNPLAEKLPLFNRVYLKGALGEKDDRCSVEIEDGQILKDSISIQKFVDYNGIEKDVYLFLWTEAPEYEEDPFMTKMNGFLTFHQCNYASMSGAVVALDDESMIKRAFNAYHQKHWFVGSDKEVNEQYNILN